MAILLVPFYLRYMGVEAYGLIGFFISLQAVISVLDMGLSTTTNREMARLSASSGLASESRNLLRTLEFVYLGISFIIALIFLLGSNWIATKWLIAEQLSKETMRIAIIVMGITTALRWPVALYMGALRGIEKQILLNLLTVGITTFNGIGTVVVLIFISPTILAFLSWQLLIGLFEVCLLAWVTWKSLPQPSAHKSEFTFPLLRNIWRFSIGVGVISIFAVILKQLDKILISKFLPLEQLGYYTTASIAITGIYRAIIPISEAVFPRLSSLVFKKDTVMLAETFHKSAQMVSFIFAPLASILIFFSYELLLLWIHSEIISSNISLVLSILAFSAMFNAMMQIPYALQLASGLTWIPLWNNGIAVIILTPLIYLSVKHYGIIGGATSWAIFNFLYYLIIPHITHRYVLKGHTMTWFFKDTLLFIAISVVIFGGIYVMSMYIGSTSTTYLLIIIGLVTYTILLFKFNEAVRYHIKEWLSLSWVKIRNEQIL